ncbi:hypothetical protein MLD38_038406 [Melastoma candidum]|uniref:Uncharacterized protein n=1 Tax=Melastoma candidum TaxID=119954 RepID=A0ACB9KZ35_9MYRT|nr:hypothetical protein MLD38_038406 [Melastoma candidum]
MRKIIGRPGSAIGMSLRMGQCGFAAASIGVMVFTRGFTGYSAFCNLIASMGLQLLWSFGLTCLDFYALRRKRDLQNPVLLSLFVVGDWVTATLSLAAACSSAGVIVLYTRDLDACTVQSHLLCTKFQVAVVLSFLTWVLIAISSHVMFWILAST